MNRTCVRVLALLVALAVAAPVAAVEPLDLENWAWFVEDDRVDHLLVELSGRFAPADYLLRNVRVVDVDAGTAGEPSAVLVRAGRVAWLGPDGERFAPGGVREIDGGGRFLAPGLTDMHVHTQNTHGHHLLQLLNGVTTVREMDGFPWMLEMRRRADEGRLLLPALSIVGHILNGMDMEYFATVVTTPEEARAAVREQAAAGYDAIKVHNVVPPPVLAAVFEESSRVGLDVVGHVPHGVTVAEGIAGGMRTLEHFKGYILDRTLTLSDEDWVAATRGAEVWNTPTIAVYRSVLRGEEALAILDTEAGDFVSAILKPRWRQLAAQAPHPAHARIRPLKEEILRRLLPIGPRLLAGTDAGSYEFMVPGFALIEELELFARLGLSPAEVLRTATSEPAAAMRLADERGRVRSGLAAELVLLDRDPTARVEHLKGVAGVGVRGRWLERRDLEEIRRRLAAIYAAGAPVPAPPPARTELEALVTRKEALRTGGYVFMDHRLEQLAGILERFGAPDLARRVEALAAR